MSAIQPVQADPNACHGQSFNVARFLSQWADSHPDRQAVIATTSRDSRGQARYESWSFAELQRKSNQCANALARGGVTPGMRVLVMVRPGFTFIYLTFALFKMRAVPVLIDPGMGVRRLLECIRGVDPQALVGIPLAQLLRLARPGAFRSVRHAITVSRRWPRRGSTLIGLMYGAAEEFDETDARSAEVAAILFTSGSTGPAKGVVYEHGMFDAQVREIQTQYGIEPGEVDLPTFPLFALFGAAMGMTCVIPDMNPSRPAKARPDWIVGAIRDQGVTTSFGSPAVWNRVADYCIARNICLSSLRRVLIAGAPVRAELVEKMRRILSESADMHTPYGATESLPVCSISGRTLLAGCTEKSRRGGGICVGEELPGMECRLIAISDDEIEEWSDELLVPDGQRGEIVVSGDVVTKAYHGQEQATRMAKILRQGQILHRMGDIGYRDEQGRIWFCGRKAHRVITDQGTLFTICCEAIFNQHENVARTALVGVGPKGLQTPVIVVELLDGRLPKKKHAAALRDELRSLAGTNDQTRGIATFLFHRSLPVDIRHNAKIDRERLAVWAERELR